MDISTDQLFKEKGDGLTQEKYEKIIALQQKHDAEIQIAEELSENRFNKEPKLIESIRLRKAELNKQICEIRKLYRTLQITCDVEFLTLVIPLSKELNISYFGTPVGEEFYKSCLKLDEIHNSFYHFSCLKNQV
ncbi:hypothetical protein GLOIN_2v1784609 [Rhizophagus irregularis DAOM 181602=DAOM 197198]|nr:hypothetical protein GLOIN_2v1784609 [Rhizophagus irregularis DAOM 181602=DAOM 197198]